MAGRMRTIVHKTIKKVLDDVAAADAPFIEMSWNEDAENERGGMGRTFMEYLAQMDKKFPGGFDVKKEEDTPDAKRRKRIKVLQSQITDPAQKELNEIMLKGIM